MYWLKLDSEIVRAYKESHPGVSIKAVVESFLKRPTDPQTQVAPSAAAPAAAPLNIEDLLTQEFIAQLLQKITELKNDFNNDVLNFFSMIRKEMSLEGAVRTYLPKELPEALETFYELHDPHENWFCTYNNFVKHIKKVRPNVSIEDAPDKNEDEDSLDNKF